MPLVVKLLLWGFFFILNIVVATGVYAFNYASTLFHMPVDVWDELGELDSQEIDEDND